MGRDERERQPRPVERNDLRGRLGTGSYEVVFNQNVTNCVYAASVGDAETSTAAVGYAIVARRVGNANAVRVDTRSATGALADRPFHVVVVC